MVLTNPNITLAGSIGSGKSTVGQILAERLKCEFISIGKIFRSIGKSSNLDTLQTNLAAESNADIDRKVDDFIVQRAQSDTPFIMDSRMAWHFVPKSLKVYLYASPKTAVNRVYTDKSRETEKYSSRGIALDHILDRRKSELARYRRLYDVDIDDIDNYDLFVVTDGAKPTEIAQLILRCLSPSTSSKSWIKPSQLVPMMTAATIDKPPVNEDSVQRNTLAALILQLFDGYGFVFHGGSQLATILKDEDFFVPFIDQESEEASFEQNLIKQAALLGDEHFADWEHLVGPKIALKREIFGDESHLLNQGDL
ncbi:MAG: cytidylate kinase family protein [Aestuariivita sp.]|nr:cytidylate kinase family protein [Aestuariivita sp.]MCY4202816.1 cytidylate kinase family protein [Aestuariivita sp.]MCY4289382.1 cytidylate kinase family protein [Aestuariivita sp.]MCY4347892.1 cytidylate kinase family protein [Aestuariivita sp.]